MSHMVRVEFQIGPYKDTIECDVVPMSVCHMLLGRPWQFHRCVKHNGRANTYQLNWHGKDIILRPMTPQQIVNESRQKTEVNVELERDEMSANKKIVDANINPNSSDKNKGVSLLAMLGTKLGSSLNSLKSSLVANMHNRFTPSHLLLPLALGLLFSLTEILFPHLSTSHFLSQDLHQFFDETHLQFAVVS